MAKGKQSKQVIANPFIKMDYNEEHVKYEEPSTSLNKGLGCTNIPGGKKWSNTSNASSIVDEARKLISDLGLSSLLLGSYMVIVKSDFDLFLADEPYVALMFLFDVRRGLYTARVWNQTVSRGSVSNVEQLVSACINHFEKRPCIGCPEAESEQANLGFLVSQTPMPRKISLRCKKVLEKDATAEYHSCRECLALQVTLHPKCKVEVTEGDEKITRKTSEQDCVTKVSGSTDVSQNIHAVNKSSKEDIEFYEYASNNETIATEDTLIDEPSGGTTDCFKCPWCAREFIHTEKNPGQQSWAFYRHRKNDHFWGLFRCPTCHLKVNFAKDLIEHMKNENHTEKQLVNCPQCKSNITFLTLDSHYKICLRNALPYCKNKNKGEPLQNVKCPWCEEYFTKDSRAFKVHKIRVHFCGKFTCSDCSFEAGFVEDLIDHVQKEKHDQNQELGCPKCDKIFRLEKIQSHISECANAQASFKCQWCSQKFFPDPRVKWENRFKIASFDVHRKLSHFWGDSFRCPQCEFEANFAQELVYHMQHYGHLAEPSVCCPQCKDEFPFSELPTHYEACVQCLRKTNATPRTSFYGKTFPRKCDLCEHVSRTSSGHMMHLRNKHFKGKFNCLKCKFMAHFAQDLVEHMGKEDHQDEPFANCPSCRVRIHISQIGPHYEGCIKFMIKEKKKMFEKNVICQTCGKTVKSHHYNNHIKIHLREQGANEDEVRAKLSNENLPIRGSKENTRNMSLFYYCDKCGKRYTNQRNLKVHIEEEHERKEYRCQECDMTFKTYKKWLGHGIIVHRTEEKYNCKYCGKRFENTGHVRSHMINHHEAPQFKCSFCGRMFKDEGRLVSHERQHTGDRPFKCSECANAYTCRKNLRQHLAGVHKIGSARGRKTGWHRNRKDKISELDL